MPMATMELIGTWPTCCGLRQVQHREELRELQSQVWILGYLGLFEEFVEGVFLVCLDFVVGFWWLYSKKFTALIRGQFVIQHVALLEAKGTQSFHSWPILCIFLWWRRCSRFTSLSKNGCKTHLVSNWQSSFRWGIYLPGTDGISYQHPA